MIALYTNPVTRYLILAVALLGSGFAIVSCIQQEAGTNAINAQAVEAASQQQVKQHDADVAATTAARDGGLNRLRSHKF